MDLKLPNQPEVYMQPDIAFPVIKEVLSMGLQLFERPTVEQGGAIGEPPLRRRRPDRYSKPKGFRLHSNITVNYVTFRHGQPL